MRKAVAGVALLAALTLTLAACGGNDHQAAGTAATAAPTTAAQAANRTTVAVAPGRLGDILVDGDGRTLYAFTKDTGDRSACRGQCASNWPALAGPARAGTGVRAALLSTSMQANGAIQVTYGGRLLYHFAGDARPGDTNGQGVGGVWFVVAANGELVKQKPAGGGYP